MLGDGQVTMLPVCHHSPRRCSQGYLASDVYMLKAWKRCSFLALTYLTYIKRVFTVLLFVYFCGASEQVYPEFDFIMETPNFRPLGFFLILHVVQIMSSLRLRGKRQPALKLPSSNQNIARLLLSPNFRNYMHVSCWHCEDQNGLGHVEPSENYEVISSSRDSQC